MINNIDQIYYRATRTVDDKVNAIIFPYDGLFEYLICKMDFFGTLYTSKDFLRHDWLCDDWNDKVTFINDTNQIKESVDLVIANNRQSQAIQAGEIADSLHVPLVVIDHEEPAKGSRTGMIDYVNKNMPKKSNFFHTNEHIAESWKSDGSNFLPYPISLPELDGKNQDMVFVGDYSPEDFDLIETLKKVFPKMNTAGYNNNTDPYVSVDYLMQNLKNFNICVTAALPTRPPFFQMLAAASACTVLSNKTPWMESIFTDGENVLFYESVDELEEKVNGLSEDKMLELGSNARQLVSEKFNFKVCQDIWKAHLVDLSIGTYVR